MSRVDPDGLYFKCRVVLEECFGSAGGVNVVNVIMYVCDESSAQSIWSVCADEGETWDVWSLVGSYEFCFLY